MKRTEQLAFRLARKFLVILQTTPFAGTISDEVDFFRWMRDLPAN